MSETSVSALEGDLRRAAELVTQDAIDRFNRPPSSGADDSSGAEHAQLTRETAEQQHLELLLEEHAEALRTPEGIALLAEFDAAKNGPTDERPALPTSWYYAFNRVRIKADYQRVQNLKQQIQSQENLAENAPTSRERKWRSRSVAAMKERLGVAFQQIEDIHSIIQNEPPENSQFLTYELSTEFPDILISNNLPEAPQVMGTHIIGDLENADTVEVRPNSMDMDFRAFTPGEPTSGYELARKHETSGLFQAHGQSLENPGGVAVINEMGWPIRGFSEAAQTRFAKYNGARAAQTVRGIFTRHKNNGGERHKLHMRGYSYAMETVVALLYLSQDSLTQPDNVKFPEGAGLGQKPLLDAEGRYLLDEEGMMKFETATTRRTGERVPVMVKKLDDLGPVAEKIRQGEISMYGADQPLSLFSNSNVSGVSLAEVLPENCIQTYTRQDRKRNKEWRQNAFRKLMPRENNVMATLKARFWALSHTVHCAAQHGAVPEWGLDATSTVKVMTAVEEALAQASTPEERKAAIPEAIREHTPRQQSLRRFGKVSSAMKKAVYPWAGAGFRRGSAAERELAGVTPTLEQMRGVRETVPSSPEVGPPGVPHVPAAPPSPPPSRRVRSAHGIAA